MFFFSKPRYKRAWFFREGQCPFLFILLLMPAYFPFHFPFSILAVFLFFLAPLGDSSLLHYFLREKENFPGFKRISLWIRLLDRGRCGSQLRVSRLIDVVRSLLVASGPFKDSYFQVRLLLVT